MWHAAWELIWFTIQHTYLTLCASWRLSSLLDTRLEQMSRNSLCMNTLLLILHLRSGILIALYFLWRRSRKQGWEWPRWVRACALCAVFRKSVLLIGQRSWCTDCKLGKIRGKILVSLDQVIWISGGVVASLSKRGIFIRCHSLVMTVSVILYFEIFFNSAFNGTAYKWTHQFQSQYSIADMNGA
jgi:hypothetical protein